jgi:hypothetical protein
MLMNTDVPASGRRVFAQRKGGVMLMGVGGQGVLVPQLKRGFGCLVVRMRRAGAFRGSYESVKFFYFASCRCSLAYKKTYSNVVFAFMNVIDPIRIPLIEGQKEGNSNHEN